jgi:hypothetical protein
MAIVEDYIQIARDSRRTGRRGIADRFCYASALFLLLIRINLCASELVRQFGRFDFDDRVDRQMLRATDTPL